MEKLRFGVIGTGMMGCEHLRNLLPMDDVSQKNHLKAYGHWAFAEFTDVHTLADDFAAKVEGQFNQMMEEVVERAARERG